MTFRYINFVILALVLFSLQGLSQIVTDRPDQTESSSTIPQGALQIEVGLQVGTEGNGEFATRHWLLPTNLFRYGVTENFELRFINQYESATNSFNSNINIQGLSDLQLGAKIQLYRKEGSNTEIALLSHIGFPTGSTFFNSDEFTLQSRFSISHDITDNFSIGYNFGYNLFESRYGDIIYTVAFGIGVNDKVAVYFEPFGEITELEEFVLNADAGFTYLIHENFQLDFSFGTGLNQRNNYFAIGGSWLFLPNQGE